MNEDHIFLQINKIKRYMNRQLVFLYRNGITKQVMMNQNLTEDVIKSAFGPEHYNNQYDCWIFTIDKYNEMLKLVIDRI